MTHSSPSLLGYRVSNQKWSPLLLSIGVDFYGLWTAGKPTSRTIAAARSTQNWCCEMQLKMQLNQSLINNDFQLIHNINKSFVLLLCIATSVKSMWVYLALGSMLHNAAFWPSFVQFCICLTRFNISHFWIITPPK